MKVRCLHLYLWLNWWTPALYFARSISITFMRNLTCIYANHFSDRGNYGPISQWGHRGWGCRHDTMRGVHQVSNHKVRNGWPGNKQTLSAHIWEDGYNADAEKSQKCVVSHTSVWSLVHTACKRFAWIWCRSSVFTMFSGQLFRFVRSKFVTSKFAPYFNAQQVWTGLDFVGFLT